VAGVGSSVSERLPVVLEALAQACAAAGREVASVRLIAVSKLQPVEAIAEALRLGQRDFGENYAQELRDKSALLEAAGPRWHFIGPLQRNKVNLVVGRACLIHSVDSVALVEALNGRVARLNAERPPSAPALTQDCLIEVNVGDEAQKAGCAPAELPVLLDAIAAAGGTLRCLGLMCLPPQHEDLEASRPYFRKLRQLLDDAKQMARPHVELRELSMGMSHDFPVAVAEGATLIRVGTALFGARPARAS
jgi:pyridoxal phosphate enzyme (YggS family)